MDIHVNMLTPEIIASGSSGNCVILGGHVMIDCGVPVKRIEPLLRRIGWLFITHRHLDHVNPAVIDWLAARRPRLFTASRIRVTEDVRRFLVGRCKPATVGLLRSLEPVVAGEPFDMHVSDVLLPGVSCRPFECVHDVPNIGFVFDTPAGRVVYATDTETMRYCPAGVFDVVLVEGNWLEGVLERLLKDPVTTARAVRNLRHLSYGQWRRFVAERAAPGAVVFRLHVSRFAGGVDGVFDSSVPVPAVVWGRGLV